MKKIVLASGNKHKLIEISQILSDYKILSCYELGFSGEIIEDGNSFYENALIKARAVFEAIGQPALADDSGLCVDALNGEPGIFSARYSENGLDNENNELLLKNLQNVSNRNAKFVCCLVYYDGKNIVTATGETYGKILNFPEGKNGFGYDPIFYSNDLNKSLGVASPEEKNSISHRARALLELKNKLQNI